MSIFTATPSGQIYKGSDGVKALFSRLFDLPCFTVLQKSESRVETVNRYGQRHCIERAPNGDLYHDGKLY